MPIAFDASAYGDVFPGTSVNYNHTCNGIDRILFVAVINGTSSSTITVTYGGIPMNQIGSATQPNGSTRFLSMFYLVNPASGSNSVSVSSNINDLISVSSVSYTGALQTGQPDNSTTNGNNASSITTSLTPVISNCWTLLAIHPEGAGASADTGSYDRAVNGDFGSPHFFDSNGPVSAGLPYIMKVDSTSSTGNAVIMISFSPIPSTNGIYVNQAKNSATYNNQQEKYLFLIDTIHHLLIDTVHKLKISVGLGGSSQKYNNQKKNDNLYDNQEKN